MGQNRKLTFWILVKDRASRAFRRVKKPIKGLRGRVSRLRQSFVSLQTLWTTLAAGAAVHIARRIFDIGAAIEETNSKFEAVFGDAIKVVDQLVDRFDVLSKRATKDLLATTGAILQGVGFAKDESAELAVQVGELARDFASFHDRNPENVFLAINAALTNEREQLKRLGIVLREKDVMDRAMLETGKANAGAITDQEKALASLHLIVEKAGVQVGDYARTQDSAKNSARKLLSSIKDLRDNGFATLVEIVFGANSGLAETADRVEQVNDRMESNKSTIVAWGRVVLRVFQFVFSLAKNTLRTLFNFGEGIGFILKATVEQVLATILSLIGSVNAVLNRTIEAANKMPGVNLPQLDTFADEVEDLHKRASENVGLAWTETAGDIKAAFEDAGQSLADLAVQIDLAREGFRMPEVEGSNVGGTPPGEDTRTSQSGKGDGGGDGKVVARITPRGETSAFGGGPLVDRRTSFAALPTDTAATPGLPGPLGTGGFAANLGDELAEMEPALETLDQKLASIAAGSLASLGDGFQGLVADVVSGSKTLGEAFAGAMRKAVASAASALGDFYMAKAAAALGEGLLGDPKGFAAAAKFAAAGLAMKGLAGLAGGMGGAGARGGGVSGRRFRREAGDRFGAAARDDARLVIRGGFLDMTDPRQERALAGALETLSGRRVTIDHAA